MTRVKWIVLGTFITAMVLYAWLVRPFILRMSQVRTIADGRSVASSLEDYRVSHGHYPSLLSDAASKNHLAAGDGWGNRWVYVTDGSSFLLLSFGRDGQPERTDYRLPPAHGSSPFYSTCGEWDRDQIISNLGVHQGCGK